MKKTNLLFACIFYAFLISCQNDEVKPESQTVTLNFETGADNGRTKGPGVRRGYKFTGTCFEYGTIVTDSQGNEHFWPADLVTKLNGFNDICPPPNQEYAYKELINPILPTTKIPSIAVTANYKDGQLFSSQLTKITVLDGNTLKIVPVYELLK